jgi:hypothetical protein
MLIAGSAAKRERFEFYPRRLGGFRPINGEPTAAGVVSADGSRTEQHAVHPHTNVLN